MPIPRLDCIRVCGFKVGYVIVKIIIGASRYMISIFTFYVENVKKFFNVRRNSVISGCIRINNIPK